MWLRTGGLKPERTLKMTDAEVLIVGAGPTGLVLALWLTKMGVRVRIIDRSAQPGTTSRALAVHSRTLELYRQLDLDVPIVEKGYTVPGARLWLGGKEAARVPFEKIVSDLTPYGFLHIFPQDEHERLLVDRLEKLGVRVERPVELLDYAEGTEGVEARLRGSDQIVSRATARFIAGCDGAHSTVRSVMQSGFPGGTYAQVFYVADIDGAGVAFNGDLNVDLEESDFLAIFPLADKGRIRLIGAIRPGEGKNLEQLTFEDVSDHAARALGLKVDKLNWFSVYHVSHRVTEHFRKGRSFLLGDAAHIHTPVGGQGMNTGIGDAINLAWKLKAVLAGQSNDSILDTFETERRAFAVRLVNTTDQAFKFVASSGHLAEIVRHRIAPIVLPQIVKFDSVRDFIFRTISQITLNYRGKGLETGRAGSVHGGDRLPWVRGAGFDNYDALKSMDWQVHVYGEAHDTLKRWCYERGVPMHAYRWDHSMADSGLKEGAVYLLRPDTYVAFANATQDTNSIGEFLAQAGIRLRPSAVS
jgi:2-polyprenyl-6-methoxyphenol hydroxylase-like FAD-dependent oxidoreductase